MTTNKGLNQPANGSNVDTWDVPVNNNFGWIDQAFGSTTGLNATSGSATLADTQYRSLVLAVTGAIAANVTYTIPTSVGGQWIVYNTTTDSAGGPWTITIASGGGGTSVVIQRSKATIIVSDGTNIRSVYAEAVSAFASGTAMLFVQTSAPTGWTKSTTHDNKALRVVSGAASSGGTTGFTSVFTARTITTSNMPAHTHGVTDPGHSHTTTFSYVSNSPTGPFDATAAGTPANKFLNTVNSATTGITINSAGSGTAMDFAVQYVDVIIATKD
jgi:hypothetical protein